MMKALIWKDIRVQRVALLATLCVIAAPYVYATYQYLADQAPSANAVTAFGVSLGEAGRITLILSLLVVAMLAGAAFATERSDRSHEFLAALPPARIAVLSSKAIVVLVAASALWLMNPYVIAQISSVLGLMSNSPSTSTHTTLTIVSAMGLSVLGVGWFGSILVSNPASSLLIGLLSPFFAFLFALGFASPTHDDAAFRMILVCACVALGCGGATSGTIYFLRREQA